jgi:hypothetical protein
MFPVNLVKERIYWNDILSSYIRIAEFENMGPFVTGNIVYISVSLMVNRKLICEWESDVALNHTQRHTTARRISPGERTAGRRDLYFYKQCSQENYIHGTPGFEPAISAREPAHNCNLDWSFAFIRRINKSDEKFQLFGWTVFKES